MKPPHVMCKKKPTGKTLNDFYRWAKSIGHYAAYEAVERYRRFI